MRILLVLLLTLAGFYIGNIWEHEWLGALIGFLLGVAVAFGKGGSGEGFDFGDLDFGGDSGGGGDGD